MFSLLVLVGCGDISNAFLLEDAEFLDSLPAESRHTVLLEPEREPEEEAPSLLVTSLEVSTTVNGVLLQLLASIDYVRTLRPTERTPDGRRWGPYPYTDDVDIEVWNNRSGAGRFDWGADAVSSTRTLTYLFGTHYAGDSVAAGDGEFSWLLGDSAEMLGGSATGELIVDYDNRDGIDLLVDIVGVSDGFGPPLTARYAFRLVEGEKDFQYTYQADVVGTDGVLEDLAIRSRWDGSVGGRADVLVSGGTLEADVERWTQCWDDAPALTYEGDERGWFPSTGDESACVYPTFAEVDRI